MTNPISNVVPTNVGGATSTNVFISVLEARDPTTSDTKFPVGKRWINTSTLHEFILMGFTAANGSLSADWELFSAATGTVFYLEGNSGGDVAPDSDGVVHVVGDGTTINIVGNPLTNTLTASLVGGTVAMDSFAPDSGTNPVVPTALGLVNMAGSGSITTVGGLNTLTTQLTGLTNHALLVGAGTTTITKVGPTSTAGQVLQSAGSSADPVFSTATYPSTTTVNEVLYSSATNTVAGITAAIDAVLVSGHTGVPGWLANGSAGQVLTANTNLPPSWQTNASGNVTGPGSSTDRAFATWNSTTGTILFDNPTAILGSGGDVVFTQATPGSGRTVQAINTDNTNTASHALFQASVAGTSGGDPYVTFNVASSRSYGIGIDNQASGQPFSISTAASGNVRPGAGTKLWNMTSAGEQTLPLQPAFLGYQSANVTNITGAGTLYTIGSTALTIVFDQGSDFTTAGVFTSPVTGKYKMESGVTFADLTVAMTNLDVRLRTSNRDYVFTKLNPGVCKDSADNLAVCISALADMDVGDTAFLIATISNGAGDTATLRGSSVLLTYFSGNLQC